MQKQPVDGALANLDLIDIDAAAAVLKLKRSTIYSLTSRRLIPHIKKGGRLYFVREELHGWILEGRRPVVDSLSAATHLSKQRGGL